MRQRYHPCSKEFQDEVKRLGLTGNQLIQKYVNEGKLKLIGSVENFFEIHGFKDNKEYKDYLAKKKGF